MALRIESSLEWCYKWIFIVIYQLLFGAEVYHTCSSIDRQSFRKDVIASAFKLSETGALLFAAVLFTIFYAVTLCLAISNRILCHFVSLLFLFTSSCVLLLRFGTPAAVDSFRIDYCLFLAYTVAVLIHLLLQLFFKSVKSSQFKVGVLIQDATVVQHQCTAV